MKLSRMVGVLLLSLAVQAQAATTLCIQIYPSSYDPGPAANSATRDDVPSSEGKQGYTVYRFGPGTGFPDPANQMVYFHFQYPYGYNGGTFFPRVDVVSDTIPAPNQAGCWQIGLVANTPGSVYANIQTLAEGSGTQALFVNAEPPESTYVVTFPSTTVFSKVDNSPCTSATCSATTVVGSLTRVTEFCPDNDPGTESVMDMHMCYTVP